MQALARQSKGINKVVKDNDLNKSKFHFDKKITCTVVDIALQKIRNQYDLNKGVVLPLRPHELSIVITKSEICQRLQGRDEHIGVISTRDLIKEDLDAHNFINYHDYQNPEWQQVATRFITNTEITEEGDLKIYFSVEFFETITTKSNYTSQNISQQQSCKNLQSRKLYDLLRPSAKNERECKTSLKDFRFILNIKDNMNASNMLAKARVLAEQISHETDITVTVTVEKINKYGGASTISFFPALKKHQTNTEVSLRKRLIDYKISPRLIDKAPIDAKVALLKRLEDRTLPLILFKPAFANNFFAEAYYDKPVTADYLRAFLLSPEEIRAELDIYSKQPFNDAWRRIIDEMGKPPQTLFDLTNHDNKQHYYNTRNTLFHQLLKTRTAYKKPNQYQQKLTQTLKDFLAKQPTEPMPAIEQNFSNIVNKINNT